jgi:hypothetical protein
MQDARLFTDDGKKTVGSGPGKSVDCLKISYASVEL